MDPHYRGYGVSARHTKGYKYLIAPSTLTDIWRTADNARHCLFSPELSISRNIIIDAKSINKSLSPPPRHFSLHANMNVVPFVLLMIQAHLVIETRADFMKINSTFF